MKEWWEEDLDRYESARRREIGSLPVCGVCGGHITDDESYYFPGVQVRSEDGECLYLRRVWICRDCMEELRREPGCA